MRPQTTRGGPLNLRANDIMGGDDGSRLESNVFRGWLRVVRRHWFMFAVLLLLPLGASCAVAVLTRSVFTASSSVVIDTVGQDVVTVRSVLSDVPADNEAIIGELELLSSRELLEHVATTLSLVNNPDFNPNLEPTEWARFVARQRATLKRWITAGGVAQSADAEPRPMNDVVDAMRASLLIAPVGRSRVIRITCNTRDPAVAAEIVNTLAAVYTAEHLRLRTDARLTANDWITERLSQLRARADLSARAAEQYRSASGLLRGRDSLLVAQQVTEASTQFGAAQARVAEARSKLNDADGASKSSQPEQIASVLSSPLVQQLRQQEARFAAARADLTTSFGPSYPKVLAAQSQLFDIQGQIAAEIRRTIVSLRDDVRAAEALQADTGKRLAESRQEVQSASTQDVRAQELQRLADVDNTIYQTFLTRARETEAQVAFPTINVRVLSTGVPANRPISPNRARIVAAGGILGLLLATAGTLARDLGVRGLRTSADVEHLLGARPFGSIPFRARRAGKLERLRYQEAVASLWTRIFIAGGSNAAPRCVVVTSALPSEGKTMLARSLAATAAAHGQRILIIDADLRRSSLSATLAMHDRERAGLYEVLRSQVALSDVIVPDSTGVDILPAGRGGDNPVKLLASTLLPNLLRRAAESYDLVIIDSPPVLIGADTWLLARSADMTLLAVRWGRTRKEMVKAALAQLLEVGVRNVEIVLSIVDSQRSALYDDATTLAVTSKNSAYSDYLARQ